MLGVFFYKFRYTHVNVDNKSLISCSKSYIPQLISQIIIKFKE